jgi:Flp pilus assembly protein TadB
VSAAAASAAAQWPGSLIAVIAAVFMALLVTALLVIRPRRPNDRSPRLVGQIDHYGPGHAAAEADKTRRAGAVTGWVAWLLRSAHADQRLAGRLERAGIDRKPSEWALIGVGICVLLAALLAAFTGDVPVAILVAAVAGWLGMRLALNFRIGRRRAAFDEQLPNVLQLVAGSLRLGFSLPQALDSVVREEGQPASGEFGLALAEARLGVELDVALDGVANRMASDDLRWTVMAIRIQREVGGNLAEVLRNTVGTMRERSYLRRQVRALSAEGRMSAYVLIALPVLVGGWLFLTSRTYMHPLYTTPIGLGMLIAAFAFVVVGAFWMRKVITVVV